MKKTIFIFILLIFFLQYSFFSMITGFEAINSGIFLSFLLVIFLRRNYFENIGWAIFGGLLVDYFSEVPFGFHVINFAVLVFLIDILKRKIALKEMHFFTVAFVVFIGVILSDFLALTSFNILSWIKITKQVPTFDFSMKYLLMGAISSTIGLLFYRLIVATERILGIGSREIKIDKL